MSKTILKVQKVSPEAKLPTKPEKDPKASGFDLYAYDVKRVYIHSGGNGEVLLDTPEKIKRRMLEKDILELQCNERALVGTGIKATIGEGYELQIRPRSGKALKQGLTVVNTPGTVDASYRGEIGIIIMNTSRKVQTIKLGEAIAQMVPMKVELPELTEMDLDTTTRGSDGFGSTDDKKEKLDDNE